MINQFLDFAQTQQNVWIITNQQLLAWMRNPKPVSVGRCNLFAQRIITLRLIAARHPSTAIEHYSRVPVQSTPSLGGHLQRHGERPRHHHLWECLIPSMLLSVPERIGAIAELSVFGFPVDDMLRLSSRAAVAYQPCSSTGFHSRRTSTPTSDSK